MSPLIIVLVLFIPLIGERLNAQMAYNIISIIGATILFTFLIARFLSLHIVEPLDQLVDAVKKMESGEFYPVEISTNDDLEVLGKAFNKMGKEITKIINDLKEIDEAKTQFLSITSHELRTPMTPIKSQLQLLLRKHFGKLNNKQVKSLRMIERNTDRLDRLLQNLLEISRIQSGRMKIIPSRQSINDVIEDVVNFMKPSADEKKIKMKTKIFDKIPEIEFDKDKISQVLQNIISNSIKFTPEGGKITISLSKYGKNGVIISTRDTGIGIPEDKCRDVFEPFFQVDSWRSRKVGGTGLGLAICKGIVEAHGGKIWCESKPNEGATFYFTLPFKIGEEIVSTPEEKLSKRVEEFFEE